MLLAVYLALSFAPPQPSAAIPAEPVLRPTTAQDQGDPKAEYKRRLEAAEGKVADLWDLHKWCEAYSLKAEARSVLRAILKLEDDRKAHELLGHHFFDGQWFTSEKKLEDYKKKQLEEEAERTGKVIYEGELVDPEDVEYLKRGMTRVDGRWIDAEEMKKLADGWVRQDLEWVSPEEAPKMEEGLWKVGDQWMTLADANAHHSEVRRWWRIPSDHFVLYSTCTREVSETAIRHMEMAFREMSRALGRVPQHPVPVLLLNSVDQYGRFARGEAGVDSPEASSLSSVHGSFFAETWLEPIETVGSGAGVAYWDASSEAGSRFGEMFARHAAAQSIVEALDPSPKVMENWRRGRFGSQPARDFWSEKQIPRWFRYGVAAYVERYLTDGLVGAGGDPYWRRTWSVSNIANKGGLDPLDRIFAFDISVDDASRSNKLINEAGLLVAFVLDGQCGPVTVKHGALKAALGSGDTAEIEKAGRELAEAITENQAKLRAFAGL